MVGSLQNLQTPNPKSDAVWPDFLGFGVAIFLAWWLDWKTTDLVWSLWLSSLLLGYLTILYTIVRLFFWGHWMAGKAEDGTLSTEEFQKFASPQPQNPVTDSENSTPGSNKHTVHLSPGAFRWFASGIALFFLGFFSLHFCGFHAGHAGFLSTFFPLENVNTGDFLGNFMWPPGLLTVAIRDLLPIYGWFLLAALLAERGRIFRGKLPTPFTTNEEAKEQLKSAQGDILFEPYKNVIRMHLLIFFFFGAHLLGFDNFVVFVVVYSLYFFPWKKLAKREGGAKSTQSPG